MNNATPKTEIEESAENAEENAAAESSEQGKKEEKSKKKVKAGEILFNKNVSVFHNEPLEQFHKGGVKAYRGTGRDKVPRNLIVFICEKSLTPRRVATVKYTRVINPNIPGLVASGRIFWPPDNAERYCFIYENTLGIPILQDDENGAALGWKPEDVLTNVVYPMINVLMDLRDKDLVHGEIWPGNMFYTGSASGDKVKLGECLTTPPSSQLPALYEPIERALADPLGKGIGTSADDLYAFGVSLAVVLRAEDPLEGFDDEKIIEQKLIKGSYTAVVGNLRLSGALLELLRGLLYDDPGQRWDLDDLQAWLDGRRLSPKQSPKRVKATRPFTLGDVKYTRPELLAKDMDKYPVEMLKLFENGEFELWIERAIEDKSVKSRIEQVVRDIAGFDRGEGYDKRVCAALSTTLYRECPVKYEGLSFIPYGFGKMMSAAYIKKKNIQPYVDVLRHSFVMQSIRHRKNTDMPALIAKFDSCRAFITQTTIQSGLERCLYFLDPSCPCLSDVVDKYYIQTPEDLIDAFEKICASSKPTVLFDRHVVSFLSVKDRKNIDPYMSDISSNSPHRRMLGQLRTLATIQKRSQLGKFPALADWMSRNLDEVYNRFHDQKKRESFRKHVDKVKKSGDLTRLALLFEDPQLYNGDLSDFYKAMREYQRLENEKEILEQKLEKKDTYGQRTGRQISSIISVVLSIVIMTIIAYATLSKG